MSRGINAIQEKSTPLSVSRTAGTYPAYIGQAPIWQIDDPGWQDKAGKLYLVTSIDQMRREIGYYEPESGAWGKDTSLCAAAAYHCKVQRVVPFIVLVNAASITVSENTTSKEVNLAAGEMAKFNTPYIVTSEVTVTKTDTDLVKGTDYTVQYDDEGRNLIVTALKDTMKGANVNYKVVETGSLRFEKDTLAELDFVEQDLGYIPDTVCAPLWDTELADAIMTIAEGQINAHWYTQGYIQLSGEDMAAAEEAAKTVKSAKVKKLWPCVEVAKLIYPAAVVYMAVKEAVDAQNGGVPYVSASNTQVSIDRLCTASGATIRLNQKNANDLNEKGIATFNFSDMAWVTWGVCMANYTEEGRGTISPDELNDVAVQMRDYVSNLFQHDYAQAIDKPMSVRDANDIVTGFQNTLDVMVSNGQLIYAKVEFKEDENSTADLASGDFTFNVAETNTPLKKSITAKIRYDAAALAESFSESEVEG
ncbi:MAG: hypothetical protein SOZ88_05580 [Lachnospiraceae bacterium]|nr:hypothetical protein [Lachnospiraceae bacterium]